MGTQTFYPRADYEIPFTLKKGLMIFKIEEPTQDDIANLESIIITSDHAWNPKTHIDDDMAIAFLAQGLQTGSKIKFLPYFKDDLVPKDDIKYFDPTDELEKDTTPGTLVICPPCSTTFPEVEAQANAAASWQRTDYKSLDPENIQPYLAWRPLEVVKKHWRILHNLQKLLLDFQ